MLTMAMRSLSRSLGRLAGARAVPTRHNKVRTLKLLAPKFASGFWLVLIASIHLIWIGYII